MKYIALIVAMLSGWVINQYLLGAAPGAFVSVLFAYHFFLVFLVGFMDWSGGFNLPVNKAVSVHGAVLILLLGFIAVRSYIPAFGIVSAFVPAFAFLEVELIFGKQRKHHESDVVPALPYSASQQDYSEFLHYLKQPGRQFAKPGRPMQEEYGFWLAERTKTRRPNQAAQGSANGPPAH
jgi:hypothetical protein